MCSVNELTGRWLEKREKGCARRRSDERKPRSPSEEDSLAFRRRAKSFEVLASRTTGRLLSSCRGGIKIRPRDSRRGKETRLHIKWRCSDGARRSAGNGREPDTSERERARATEKKDARPGGRRKLVGPIQTQHKGVRSRTKLKSIDARHSLRALKRGRT